MLSLPFKLFSGFVHFFFILVGFGGGGWGGRGEKGLFGMDIFQQTQGIPSANIYYF